MEEFEVVDKCFTSKRDVEDADSSIYEEPVYALKEGLDLRNLKDGAVFEVDLDLENTDSTNVGKQYFDDEELLKNLNMEDTCLDTGNSDDELEPFESLRKKMTHIKEGIYKKVKFSGHGILVPEKAFVTIHYNMFVEYSDEPFDSSRLRNVASKFLLNTGSVIGGLDIAITTMQTGEVSQFLVPPELAFGEMGVPPRIPPKATILCEIELINFVESASLAHMNELTPDERKTLTFQEKLDSCRSKHSIGNNHFKEKAYRKAIMQYRGALKILENSRLADEDEEKQYTNMLLKLNLNTSQCYLMLSSPRQAKIHLHRILDINPDNTKANYRMGKALKMEGEHQLARKYLRRALRVEPNNSDIVEELQKVDKLIKESLDLEKRFCRKMFGQQTFNPVQVQNKGDQEFENTIKECLVNFKNDESLVEMPFGCGFSATEINCVKQIAESMDLDVQENMKNLENTLKVLKKKA